MEKNRLVQYVIAAFFGLVVLASIVFFAFYLPKLESARQEVAAPVKGAALGEAGARCGGDLRLPCRPGNACRISDPAKKEGVCVKVTDTPSEVKP